MDNRLSDEIRVTNDTDHQYDHGFATAAVGAGGDGDFIVTWSSYDTGGSAWNAMARRYTANDVTKFTYDELHRITKIDEAYNSPTEHRTTTFAYDAAGNLLSTRHLSVRGGLPAPANLNLGRCNALRTALEQRFAQNPDPPKTGQGVG